MFPFDHNLEVESAFEPLFEPSLEDSPFHMLLVGNWSGDKPSESAPDKPLLVDRDNFDEVMSKLKIQLSLDIIREDKNLLNLSFSKIDDFHPDNIYRNVPLFSELGDLRRRLLNENTYNDAAAEIRSRFYKINPDQPVISNPKDTQPEIPEIDSGILLDDVLSQSSSEHISKTTITGELDDFLTDIVKPFIIQTDENEQAELLKVIDETISNLMRLILHHPKFQELEAAWRGVFLLVRKIETDADLKFFLYDLSKNDLLYNLGNSKNLYDTDLYKVLVKNAVDTPNGVSWALVCGNYTFDVNVKDIAALIRISQISKIANAPFISHILPDAFGVFQNDFKSGSIYSENSDESKLWTILRSSPEADFLGFVMPRFLARLPYGRDTDPTENFSFEEFTYNFEHSNYLWSNSCFVFAVLFAQTFRSFSWEISRNFQYRLDDLPTHIYKSDGNTNITLCTEILLTETVCRKLINEGIMPLVSFRNTDVVQLGELQSVSPTNKNFSGKWT